METLDVISAILIYFVLPVLVIFGTMVLLRRKREKYAGRIKSTGDKKVKAKEINYMKKLKKQDTEKPMILLSRHRQEQLILTRIGISITLNSA